MNQKTLERRCINLYSRKRGKSLFGAMSKIAKKDFCVATGWESDEVSISISCNKRGRIFGLTPDYQSIVLPGGGEYTLEEVGYLEIARYLKRNTNLPKGELHCDIDRPNQGR